MSKEEDSSHSGPPAEPDGPSHAPAGTGTKGLGRQWSDPLPLKDALPQSPVLVQLEDGSRGAVESLSFSQGDVMALEGEIRMKDRRLVLAHFTTEMENEDGEKEEESMYRSLLSIPWEQLPEVDVRMCLDSEGLAYTNFVTTHFPQCNWRQQQKQLLDDMEDIDYYNIREITPVPLPSQTTPLQAPKERRPPPPPPSEPLPSSPLSQRSPSTPRRPPPVPPRTSSRDDVRKGTRGQVEADDTPPPRPPKTIKSQSSTPIPPSASKTEPEPLFPSELAEQDTSESQIYEYDHDYIEVMDNDDDEDDDVYIDLKDPRNAAAISAKLKQKPEKSKQTSKKEKKEEKKDSTNKKEKKESKKIYFGFRKQEQKDIPKDAAKTASVKPTVRVQPLTSKPTSPMERAPMMSPVTPSPEEKSDSDEEYCYDLPSDFGLQVHKMTCRQLCARLRLCGMPDLATACDSNRLDGTFFFSLSDDDLRKPPFSLSNFEINIKLQKVKSGWIPK